MKELTAVFVMVCLVASASVAHSQSRHSFAFQTNAIGGFPTGQVFLTGGGTFDAGSGFLQGGGGFRCLQDIDQGPLAGCRAGEGVRWDAVEILAATDFKCGGSASEPLKHAATDDHTLVMQADFYRQGDGNHESFTARMIVSDFDLDGDAPGFQNVWIQGVGCAEATLNFR